MGKCAEFVHGTTGLGNYRAGERQSWLGVFAFVRGPESVYGTTGSSTPVFRRTQTWEAPLSGTHVWDQGDPGGKPGAFLPGPRVFLRSRREDHGLNGYGLAG